MQGVRDLSTFNIFMKNNNVNDLLDKLLFLFRWYVRKHLTEETGWVPAQYLKDEETYTMYVQRKLVEKIEKLPVFESKLFFMLKQSLKK